MRYLMPKTEKTMQSIFSQNSPDPHHTVLHSLIDDQDKAAIRSASIYTKTMSFV